MRSTAEAPAKVILSGEHFVVHGAWALAAAIPRMVRVEVQQAEGFSVDSDRYPKGSRSLAPVSRLVEEMAREYSFSPSLRVTVRSEVPEGAGLGSSAATMVALVAALSRLHALGLGWDEVAARAMSGERLVHGRPSGVDPAVCAMGGVILFRTGSKPRRVHLNRGRSLVVSFSGQRRSTRGQIAKVTSVGKGFPSLFSRLAEAVGESSLAASEALASGDMEELGGLMTLGHAVLSSLGVSNRTLDRQVDHLISEGCYGAKLTGAGGGGSVVGVAPEGKEKRIASSLGARGYETFVAEIPVGGVRSWLGR